VSKTINKEQVATIKHIINSNCFLLILAHPLVSIYLPLLDKIAFIVRDELDHGNITDNLTLNYN